MTAEGVAEHAPRLELLHDRPPTDEELERRASTFADADMIFILTGASEKGTPVHDPLPRDFIQNRGGPLVFVVARSEFKPHWASSYMSSVLEDLPAARRALQGALLNVSESKRLARSTATRLEAQEERRLERIGNKATQFIEPAIATLKTFESRSRIGGITWYAIGFIALLAGIYVATQSVSTALSYVQQSWIYFSIVTLKSLGLILLLGVTSRYSFVLGQSYTSEAHKATNRLHAISFGRFYLETYGATANWTEVKDAFADWNIDRGSAFDKVEPNAIDAKLPDGFVEILRLILQARGDK